MLMSSKGVPQAVAMAPFGSGEPQEDVPLASLVEPKEPAYTRINAFKAAVSQADQFRGLICAAAVDGEYHKLPYLLDRLAALAPSVALLKATGVGFLLKDQSLWRLAGDKVAKKADKIQREWAADVPYAGKQFIDELPKAPQPFNGLRFSSFADAAAKLDQEFLEYLEGETDRQVCKQLAVVLCMNGFRSARHLEGAQMDDFKAMVRSPAQRAMLGRIHTTVEARMALKRRRLGNALEIIYEQVGISYNPATEAPGAVESAQQLAGRVSDMDVDEVHNVIDKTFRAFKVPMGTGATPAATIHAMEAATQRGVPVGDLLVAKAGALRLETKRSSLSAVGSALRCWHAFAVTVLAYEADKTMPPKCSQDVESWVAVFRNGNTASNYVGYLRWACTHLHISTAWDSRALMDTVRGARKRHERVHGGTKHAAQFLTDDLLAKIVNMADTLEMPEFGHFAVVCWEFLLRVQSEAIPMLAGSNNDTSSLPTGRHSGLWIDNENQLCLRLARRKNRPSGSFLRRGCVCATKGKSLCGVHRLRAFLASKQVAAPLWSFTPAKALHTLKRMLVLCRAPNHAAFTLKAFRAGRATQLAAQGKSLGAILQAGEWRSSAFLSYIDTDAVDSLQLLDQTLALSDEEA